MKRDIKLTIYDIVARACIVKKHAHFEETVLPVMSVDIKGSKALQMASGDFGIVIYNELNFGFMISWKEFKKIQTELNIKEDDEEDFLDSFTTYFSETIIKFLNDSNLESLRG